MKILFDNNGFATLSQQESRKPYLVKLEKLIERGKIEVIGSATMLMELSGLSASNHSLYLNTLQQYENLTQKKILKDTTEIMQYEIEKKRSVLLCESLQNVDSFNIIFDGLKDGSKASLVSEEVIKLKAGYATKLEDCKDSVLAVLGVNGITQDIREGYKKWQANFERNIEDLFVRLYDNPPADISVKELLHISAYLGYFITRIYERFVLNIKNYDNDYFDNACFADAAVVDILVTNDGKFTRTGLRVPNRNFGIMGIDEFQRMLDNL